MYTNIFLIILYILLSNKINHYDPNTAYKNFNIAV